MAKKQNVYAPLGALTKVVEPVDASQVQEALGASISAKSTNRIASPFSLRTLQTKLLGDLVSTGGRPGRREATTLKKVPLTSDEWKTLDDMTEMLKRRGVNATSGQVAGVLLNQSILEFRRAVEHTATTDHPRPAQQMTDGELEQTVEEILAAAASAEAHLEELRPVALELLRRMRAGKGVEAHDDSEK